MKKLVRIRNIRADAVEQNKRHEPEEQGHLLYKKPEVFLIDTAMHLMQQNISGHMRDGVEGWYVWGS